MPAKGSKLSGPVRDLGMSRKEKNKRKMAKIEKTKHFKHKMKRLKRKEVKRIKTENNAHEDALMQSFLLRRIQKDTLKSKHK